MICALALTAIDERTMPHAIKAFVLTMNSCWPTEGASSYSYSHDKREAERVL
jgi:hypothetical protein